MDARDQEAFRPPSSCRSGGIAPAIEKHSSFNPLKLADYRPDIDGLRAVSVIAVVLFHLDLGLTGGFVGVDVFFVISGFLITGLILKDQKSGQFSLVNFWERRVRRIFPAAFVTVASVMIIGLVLLTPADLQHLAQSVMYHQLISSNIFFWHDRGYFALQSEFIPLLHTWSLAVEEQFYLVYPLLLVLIAKYASKQWHAILLCLAVTSLTACLYWTYKAPNAAFYLLPFRVWELLVGGLIAFLADRRTEQPNRTTRTEIFHEAMALAGLIGIVSSFWIITRDTRFPGAAAVVPVGGAACVIYANGRRTTWVTYLLSSRVLVFVGLISYSWYLWHWPIIVFARHITLDTSLLHKAILLVLGFGLAVLSWRFVEKPFRDRSRFRSRRRIFAYAGGATLALLVIAGTIVQQRGMPSRFDPSLLVIASDVDWNRKDLQVDWDQMQIDQLPRIGAVQGANNDRTDFIIWGDSHGMALSDVADQTAKKFGLSGRVILRSGTAPIPNLYRPAADPTGVKTIEYNRLALEAIKHSGTKNVLLIARWSAMCEGYNRHEIDSGVARKPWSLLVCDDQNQERSAENAAQCLERHLKSLLDVLRREGIQVWLFAQVPEIAEVHGARRFLLWSRFPRFNNPPRFRPDVHEHTKRQYRVEQIFCNLDAPNLRIVRPADKMFDPMCSDWFEKPHRAIYRDDDHLTRYGAEIFLNSLFCSIFSEIASAKESKVGETNLFELSQLPYDSETGGKH